jgi:glutathione-independent formaldehyde dehydrogenase
MSKNRGVVYTKPGEVQVQDIADPKFENPRGRKIEHGVILKVVSTNICGSDQHMGIAAKFVLDPHGLLPKAV